MPNCLYCNNDKPADEFTLEHVIPQFLGGAQAPDELKTRRVCKTCNSNLGLFVDAGFEKDFLVFNQLNEAAYAFFNPDEPSSLPLHNMGISDLTPPGMKEDEVCEYWLGPLGEQIIWIRPSDERMYWYSGGNPRTVKKVRTRAYFLWAERSQKNPIITWLAFRDAFLGRKVKKLMCTKLDGADPKYIGFSEPDELDNERIEYFKKECSNGEERKNKLSMYVRYDIRFMAKLAIGLSHVIFGSTIEKSHYSNALRQALWFREGDSEPTIEGQSNLGEQDQFLKEQCGVSNGVTVTILPVSTGVAVNLNLNKKMNWVVNCAKIDEVSDQITSELSHGICVILYRSLNKGIKLSLPELIAHNQGSIIHQELAEVEKLAGLNEGYFANL